MDLLEKFDNVVRRYEKASGKTIDDDQKVGLLHKNMKDQKMQEHLILNADKYPTYKLICQEIRRVMLVQKSHSGEFIGAIGGGGGT